MDFSGLVMAHQIDYSRDAAAQISALPARQRTTVLDGVDKHLKHQPLVETRNRKPMTEQNRAMGTAARGSSCIP
jgi:hypothetical protein